VLRSQDYDHSPRTAGLEDNGELEEVLRYGIPAEVRQELASAIGLELGDLGATIRQRLPDIIVMVEQRILTSFRDRLRRRGSIISYEPLPYGFLMDLEANFDRYVTTHLELFDQELVS
jgi:hypothetical protein